MLHCDFDGGLDLARMISIDCALDGLHGEVRFNYISRLKQEKHETWDDYVDQKKKWVLLWKNNILLFKKYVLSRIIQNKH